MPHARVTFQALYPDPLGRIIASADYGTNGGEPLDRPATVPSRSLEVRVSTTDFNEAGQPFRTTDPNWRKDEKTFDAAGHLIQTVENVTNSTADDQNRTTEFAYNLDGKMTTLTARNAVTGDQVTQWVYGTNLQNSGVARKDLLREKRYPDWSPSPSSSDSVLYAYNRLGELTQQTDQALVQHAFLYDKLGRLLHDCVTRSANSSIDGFVQRISRTYNERGLLALVTSYASADLGNTTIRNQITRAYNAFGQLTEEKQSHSGAVSTGTPAVGYGYEQDKNSSVPNTIRPAYMIYPNNRRLDTLYGDEGGMNDVVSRVEKLWEDEHLDFVTYAYLGAAQVVEAKYVEPNLKLAYLKQGAEGNGEAGDQYAGLDRFGRIVDQRWIPCGSSSSSSSSSTENAVERVQFTYDRAGNIIRRHNLVAPGGQDEVYEYDGLYQLKNFQRGTLELESDIWHLASPPDWTEDFTYDPLGNWQHYQTDDGTTQLDQSRTQNPVNEITGIDNGPIQPAAAYDATGNMTQAPKPDDWSTPQYLYWDAWNRLVRVEQEGQNTAYYAYDGLTRRVTKTILYTTRHYYFSSNWQVLEERVENLVTHTTSLDRQWVWGQLRLDDAVLRDRSVNGTVDERIYVLADHLSPRAAVNPSGAVVERHAYDAFGNTRVMESDWVELLQSAYDWEVRLHGYRWDEETGLYQVRYRYLHPALGRWVSRDPMTKKDICNLYTFVNQSPLMLTDPKGQRATASIGDSWCELVCATFVAERNWPPGGGGCVCYGGNRCPCIWGDNVGICPALDQCGVAHEQSHCENPNAVCSDWTCSLTLGGSSSPASLFTEECKAREEEITCLLQAQEANSYEPCETLINDQIQNLRSSLIEKHCPGW